jgi:Arc/MetJ family transcription regulator
MRTTINLDDELMQSIMKVSGMKNKTEIIHQALSDLLSKMVRENIGNAYGKLNFELDVREYRNRELDAESKLTEDDVKDLSEMVKESMYQKIKSS